MTHWRGTQKRLCLARAALLLLLVPPIRLMLTRRQKGCVCVYVCGSVAGRASCVLCGCRERVCGCEWMWVWGGVGFQARAMDHHLFLAALPSNAHTTHAPVARSYSHTYTVCTYIYTLTRVFIHLCTHTHTCGRWNGGQYRYRCQWVLPSTPTVA